MIPIRLNLLSEEKRRAHRRTAYVQCAKNILEVLLILLCLSTIALVCGYSLLENRLQDIASHQLVADSSFTKTNREVDAVNRTVRAIETIQDEHVFWIPFISDFANAVPGDIRLDSLSMDAKGRAISMAGYAPTRDALLALEKSIERISWAEPFDIPVRQLTEKKDVAFSFAIRIKE